MKRSSLGLIALILACLSFAVSTQDSSPTSPVSEVVYGYLNTPRNCSGAGPFIIPVYVSVPVGTPIDDEFALLVENATSIALHREDESMLVGHIEIPELPREFLVQCTRNGNPIDSPSLISLENGYQAITLAISAVPHVSDTAPFGEGFLRGATVSDNWGTYLYGAAGEGAIHTRDYFATTCDRLLEDGVEDVYVTTFLEYVSLLPHPQIGLMPPCGAGAISDEDLRSLVAVAHERGLRLHIRYDIYSDRISLAYLGASKRSGWIEEFFEQYGAVLLSEAAKAEEAGVDGVVVGFGMNYEGHESSWGEESQSLLTLLDSVFSGQIVYRLSQTDAINYVSQRLPAGVFEDADAFLWGPWDPMLALRDDSYPALLAAFQERFRQFDSFMRSIEKPFYLGGVFQSTDGYMVNGWYDVAIGKLGSTVPDFFEQSRGYEALFEVIANTDLFDGVVLYKYNWDDPFGPDLPGPALARMDLSASVRNKPAEATVKRWFGGIPGPAAPIPADQRLAMRRPWCDLFVAQPNELENTSCLVGIDDFERAEVQANTGRWFADGNCASGSVQSCGLYISDLSGGQTHLVAESQRDSLWTLVLEFPFPVAASDLAGIGFTLWSDSETDAEIELACRNGRGENAAFVYPSLNLGSSRKSFRIPFTEFLPYAPMTARGVPVDYLAGIRALKLRFSAGTHKVHLDDICFYDDSQ